MTSSPSLKNVSSPNLKTKRYKTSSPSLKKDIWDLHQAWKMVKNGILKKKMHIKLLDIFFWKIYISLDKNSLSKWSNDPWEVLLCWINKTPRGGRWIRVSRDGILPGKEQNIFFIFIKRMRSSPSLKNG